MRLTTFATVLMGLVTLCLLLDEWNFRRRTRAGQAVVVGTATYSRSGEVIAGAVHVVKGQRIRATVRGWFCGLRSGQRVDILFFPGDPKNVVLDWFWQRHYGSVTAFAVFAILAHDDVRRARDQRRRLPLRSQSDDDLGPMPPRSGIRLPIDTAPPLWDRELDG